MQGTAGTIAIGANVLLPELRPRLVAAEQVQGPGEAADTLVAVDLPHRRPPAGGLCRACFDGSRCLGEDTGGLEEQVWRFWPKDEGLPGILHTLRGLTLLDQGEAPAVVSIAVLPVEPDGHGETALGQ